MASFGALGFPARKWRRAPAAYRPGDLDILASFGLAGGYLSVLILALYPLTAQAHAAFRSPQALWMLCPLLLYWFGRIWVYARRGRIPDDPVLFVLSDSVSGYIALACAGIVAVAAFREIAAYCPAIGIILIWERVRQNIARAGRFSERFRTGAYASNRAFP